MEGSAFKELGEEKRAVSSLKNEFNLVANKLDALFNRKRDVGKGIAERLRKVKVLREQRNMLTGGVKTHKGEREKIREVINTKIEDVKKLYNQRDEIAKKHKIKVNISALQREIERLEYRIETEGMDFNSEQKVMKRIKQLRKEAEEGRDVSDIWERIRAAEKEIKQLKDQNEEEHKKVQSHADESQKRHEELVQLLKDVDELRLQEDAVLKEMDEIKKVYDDSKQKLELELLKLNDAGKKAHAERDEGRRARQNQIEKDLENKGRSVEEKIRKGEKLTTADLLAWQAREKGQ